ncbi:MAG: radical SAM family heme chaperone HemW [Clostridia bacterium]|nr:radical SAM family heme chaperone HemW [Clostridia bacterium]
MKKLGLYIHIPFCVRKCAYCDFYSINYTNEDRVSQYVNALCSHIERESHLYSDYEVDTVFMGGGTPSILEPNHLDKIVSTIKSCFKLTQGGEFTIEANPGTLTREKLECYLKNGINRLSIGLQSANEKELLRLGRIHNIKDFEDSLALARECGFENISVDVMYGLPDQTMDDFAKTLDYVCEINPNHISAYCLKIEDNTFFGQIKEKLNLPDDEKQYEMYLELCSALSKRGWEQYEISNFAKKGYRSQHNLKYWASEEFVGFGPASYSYFNGERYFYSPSLNDYIKNPVKIVEKQDEKTCEVSVIDKIDEYVMLKLRLSDGISDRELNNKFGISFKAAYPRIEKYLRSGHMKCEGDTYSFTSQGFFVSNYILTDILRF